MSQVIQFENEEPKTIFAPTYKFYVYEGEVKVKDIRDTILPTTRDELICKVVILGYTKDEDNSSKLLPLIYPVRPAATVKYPSSEDVEALLISDLNSSHPIYIGSLLAREAVKIRIDVDNLVSRHVSIFGMSVLGKL